MTKQFPKYLRVRKSGEFKAAFDHDAKRDVGRVVKLVRREFVLLAYKRLPREANQVSPLPLTQQSTNKNESCMRLGLVVSKKIGNAVVRNRVKRYFRECFRRTNDEFGRTIVGYDLIVIARPPMNEMNFARTLNIWNDALYRLAKIVAKASKSTESPIDE